MRIKIHEGTVRHGEEPLCLKAHGVVLDLTLDDVRRDSDAALASSR